MISIPLRYVCIIRKPGGKIYLSWKRRGGKSVSLTEYGEPRVPTNEKELHDKLAHPLFVAKVHDLNRRADNITANAVSDHGSFQWLIRAYEQSPDFIGLSTRTKKNYRDWLGRLKPLNAMPISVLDDPKEGRKLIHATQQRFTAHPHTANEIIATLKTLIDWAIRAGHMERNPAKMVRALKTKARRTVWTVQDQEKWLSSADSTMQLAFLLGLYTGQRQADILSLKWDQISGDYIAFTQGKTGETVSIRLHQDLKKALSETPRHDEYVLMWQDSRPGHPTEWCCFKSAHFSHAFTGITKACGLTGLQFRDLRRTLLTRLSAIGATPQQLSDVSGHKIGRSMNILDTYVARNPGELAAQLPPRETTTS